MTSLSTTEHQEKQQEQHFVFSILVASNTNEKIKAATDSFNKKKDEIAIAFPILNSVHFHVYTAKDTGQPDITGDEPQPVGVKRMIECARKRVTNYNVPFAHTKSKSYGKQGINSTHMADFFIAYENAVVKEDFSFFGKGLAYDQAAIILLANVFNSPEYLTFSDKTYFPVEYYNYIVLHDPSKPDNDMDTCGKWIASLHGNGTTITHRDWHSKYHQTRSSRVEQLTYPDGLAYEYLENIMMRIISKVTEMQSHL